MPSASIPKTRFLPAQNPPFLPPPIGPPQILSSLASFAQLQTRNTKKSLPFIQPPGEHQKSRRRPPDTTQFNSELSAS